MDWKKQFKFHDLSFWNTCLTLLIVAAVVLILWFVQTQREPANKAKALQAICSSRLSRLYKMMQAYDIERPPEWTVADWFQAARKDRQASSSPLPEKEFFCRSAGKPYLVFPVPASVLFTASDPPVPVLMCPPGEYGANILYSDGTIVPVSREEVEQLVSEYSPEPLKIVFETQPEADK
jgi:hypothetical protein